MPIATESGHVACTHLWWSSEGPEIDPLAVDRLLLVQSRKAILDVRPVLIIPGHGAPFTPSGVLEGS